MAETEQRTQIPWMNSEQSSRVEINGHGISITEPMITDIVGSELGAPEDQQDNKTADSNLGIGERAFSAAGAAVLSAIIVNPLDVVKTRLQAQAAGVHYSHPLSNLIGRMAYFGPNMMFADLRCSPSCTRAGVHGTVSICPPDCFQYKGTLDVFNKIIRQEGFARLWRGTNAGLALAVPTVGIYLPCYDIFRNWMEGLAGQYLPGAVPYAPLVAGSLARSLACATCYPIELARTRMQAFKDTQIGKKPPGVFSTLLGVLSDVKGRNPQSSLQGYRVLWTGMGAQLARDVPFSGICWSTLEPIRRKLLGLVGEESNVLTVLGANFSSGFFAGSLAAAATCPLDVAKTRRQIERDHVRALRMTTRQTLMEVWRDGGMRGLFTGVGPRVARAGPSVGIVVSFYEVVKDDSFVSYGKIYIRQGLHRNVCAIVYEPSSGACRHCDSDVLSGWRGPAVVVDGTLYVLDQASEPRLWRLTMMWQKDIRKWVVIRKLPDTDIRPPYKLVAVGKQISVRDGASFLMLTRQGLRER
ncbi:hypothetical protein V6N12_005140 [Hibiscus sabdariffa]|uniref:Mitochondrial carrier protein n=1 Tax=Hibiscus sabdariffa TaxID=183260 RepID=A0ABR2CNL6_9ROSI